MNANAQSTMPNPAHAAGCSTPRDPRWNGLKHGMRSQVQVLPWEDAGEFARMRLEMYETFRPKTGNEARCVEAMVNHEWGMERCRRVRDEYHGKMTAVLHGDSAAGEHCEGDPHRWHHKALDCTLEEGRLQRHQERERRKFAELQRMRRLRLMEEVDEACPAVGPAPLPDLLPTSAALGESGDEEPRERVARPATSGSTDGEIGDSRNRMFHTPAAAALPGAQQGHSPLRPTSWAPWDGERTTPERA